MPLENAKPGTPGFSRNIATEIKAGKPQKQAVAIAYSKAREGSRGDAGSKKYTSWKEWNDDYTKLLRKRNAVEREIPLMSNSDPAKQAKLKAKLKALDDEIKAHGEAERPASGTMNTWNRSRGDADWKVGQSVHLGLRGKGGAGMYGKIVKLGGGDVWIKHQNGKEYKGPVEYLSASNGFMNDSDEGRSDSVDDLLKMADKLYARADSVVAKLDEQSRDPDGKFGSGGGSSAAPATKKQRLQDLDARHAKEYQANAKKAKEELENTPGYSSMSEGEKTKAFRELEKKHDGERMKRYFAEKNEIKNSRGDVEADASGEDAAKKMFMEAERALKRGDEKEYERLWDKATKLASAAQRRGDAETGKKTVQIYGKRPASQGGGWTAREKVTWEQYEQMAKSGGEGVSWKAGVRVDAAMTVSPSRVDSVRADIAGYQATIKIAQRLRQPTEAFQAKLYDLYNDLDEARADALDISDEAEDDADSSTELEEYCRKNPNDPNVKKLMALLNKTSIPVNSSIPKHMAEIYKKINQQKAGRGDASEEWIVLNNGSTGGRAGTRHKSEAEAKARAAELRRILKKENRDHNNVTVVRADAGGRSDALPKVGSYVSFSSNGYDIKKAYVLNVDTLGQTATVSFIAPLSGRPMREKVPLAHLGTAVSDSEGARSDAYSGGEYQHLHGDFPENDAAADGGYTEIWTEDGLDQEVHHSGNYKQVIEREKKDLQKMGFRVKLKHFDKDGKPVARLDAGERTVKRDVLDRKVRDGLWEIVWEPDRNGRATIKHSRDGRQETIRVDDMYSNNEYRHRHVPDADVQNEDQNRIGGEAYTRALEADEGVAKAVEAEGFAWEALEQDKGNPELQAKHEEAQAAAKSEIMRFNREWKSKNRSDADDKKSFTVSYTSRTGQPGKMKTRATNEAMAKANVARSLVGSMAAAEKKGYQFTVEVSQSDAKPEDSTVDKLKAELAKLHRMRKRAQDLEGSAAAKSYDKDILDLEKRIKRATQ